VRCPAPHSRGQLGQAQVKRETALEQPTIRSDRNETSPQTIEGYPLAIPRYLRSPAARSLSRRSEHVLRSIPAVSAWLVVKSHDLTDYEDF
jgi:hypothetical protein